MSAWKGAYRPSESHTRNIAGKKCQWNDTRSSLISHFFKPSNAVNSSEKLEPDTNSARGVFLLSSWLTGFHRQTVILWVHNMFSYNKIEKVWKPPPFAVTAWRKRSQNLNPALCVSLSGFWPKRKFSILQN